MGFTNFPNGITSFGVPIIGGANIPGFFDRSQDNLYWFVDGRNGSTNNNGKSSESPLSTVASAITKARDAVTWSNSPWGPRHVIIIAPGTYAEALTALPHGCVLYGMGHDIRDAQAGVKIAPASGSPVVVSGIINTAFYNIGFESTGSNPVFSGGEVNNCLFQNCRFSGPAETVTATYAFYSVDCTYTKWINCEFSCAAVGLGCIYVNANDKFAHCLVQGCKFDQLTTGIKLTAGLVGPSSLIKDCTFMGAGQTMTTAIWDEPHVLDVAWCACESTAGQHATHTARSLNAVYLNGQLQT